VLVEVFRKQAGNLGAQFCGESTTLEAILDSIRQASDIMKDGTQNPDAVCDGISIGLGFETRRSLLGEPTPVVTPADPCEGLELRGEWPPGGHGHFMSRMVAW
jgi:hypothetical protein